MQRILNCNKFNDKHISLMAYVCARVCNCINRRDLIKNLNWNGKKGE